MITNSDAAPKTLGTPWSTGDRLAAETVLFLLAWGVVALALALVGWLHWWTVAPTSAVVHSLLRRRLPRSELSLDRWWRAALVFVVAIGVLNAANPAEHLFTGRDGGTYLATAGWLAQDGSLLVDAKVEAFAGNDDLEYVVPGFYDRVGGRDQLEPQFMHMFPAMMGTLIDIGGVPLGLVLNAIIGGVALLALFALARRFTKGWAATVAMLAVGSSLVFLYYSRAPFTELLMAAFVLGGIWLLGVAEERRESFLFVIAGVLLGAATMVRLDGVVLLLPATAYLLLRGAGQPDLAAALRRTRYAMYLTALAGLAESLYISPAYILERSANVVPILAAVLALLIGFDLFGRWRGTIESAILAQKRALFVVGVVVGGVLLSYAWFVRPVVEEAQGGGYGLETLQELEGLEVDSDRNYAEQSVRWVVWYYGEAFVVLAFVGAAVLVRRRLLAEVEHSAVLFAAVLLVFATLYFWRPSINPDQIWAMRRFLTVVVPLGAVAAVIGIDSAVDTAERKFGSRTINLAVGATLSFALVAPAVATTVPVWDIDEFAGLSSDFADLCQAVGPDSYVIITDKRLGLRFSQSFRSYCGVPAAWSTLDAAALDDLRDKVESVGGSLVVVAAEGPGTAYLDRPYEFLEITLSRAPNRRVLSEMTLVISD